MVILPQPGGWRHAVRFDGFAVLIEKLFTIAAGYVVV